jgi:hypothetical protein
MSGKKEGDVSDVLEAGSTLYAVHRSPARPTPKISLAGAQSQARRSTILGGDYFGPGAIIAAFCSQGPGLRTSPETLPAASLTKAIRV